MKFIHWAIFEFEIKIKILVTKVEGDVCREFKHYGTCKRRNCPFLHQIPKETSIFKRSNNKKNAFYISKLLLFFNFVLIETVTNSNQPNVYFNAFIDLDLDLKHQILVFKSISVNLDSSISGCVQAYVSEDYGLIDVATDELQILSKEMKLAFLKQFYF